MTFPATKQTNLRAHLGVDGGRRRHLKEGTDAIQRRLAHIGIGVFRVLPGPCQLK